MFSVIWNVVVYYFINRDIDGFWIVVVVEVGGDCVLFVNDVIVIDMVQFVGGDVWFDIWFDYFQYFGCQMVCDVYFFDVFRCFDRDSYEFCLLVLMILVIIV